MRATKSQARDADSRGRDSARALASAQETATPPPVDPTTLTTTVVGARRRCSVER